MKRMMTELIVAAAFLLLPVKGDAIAAPIAPNTLIIVACKTIDMTGLAGRHGVDEQGNYHPELAAKDWRDLELYINPKTLAYQCKREKIANIVDSVPYLDGAPDDIVEMNPDFGNPGNCARIGVFLAQGWNQSNPGWGVVAVGCPSPIAQDADNDGKPDLDEHGNPIIVGWKEPGCPSHLPGTVTADNPDGNRMRCDFDESAI